MASKLVLPGVVHIDLPWVNCWLLSSGRDAALIDCGTRWDRRRILESLDSFLPSGFRVLSVILTHGHCDHAGNAAFFQARDRARIVAHVEETPFIATRRTYVPRGIRAISPKGLVFASGEVFFPVRRTRVDEI